MFGAYAMDLGAYNDIFRAHPDMLGQDNATNYIMFIRTFVRAFFTNEELLTCNIEGTNGLDQLCPPRVEVLLQYVKHYFPVTYGKGERRAGGVQHPARLINTVLRQRRNDNNKKYKLQA